MPWFIKKHWYNRWIYIKVVFHYHLLKSDYFHRLFFQNLIYPSPLAFVSCKQNLRSHSTLISTYPNPVWSTFKTQCAASYYGSNFILLIFCHRPTSASDAYSTFSDPQICSGVSWLLIRWYNFHPSIAKWGPFDTGFWGVLGQIIPMCFSCLRSICGCGKQICPWEYLLVNTWRQTVFPRRSWAFISIGCIMICTQGHSFGDSWVDRRRNAASPVLLSSLSASTSVGGGVEGSDSAIHGVANQNFLISHLPCFLFFHLCRPWW